MNDNRGFLASTVRKMAECFSNITLMMDMREDWNNNDELTMEVSKRLNEIIKKQLELICYLGE